MEAVPPGTPDPPQTRTRPRYVPYTRRRMAERGITEEDVEYVLEHYDTRRPAPPYRTGNKPSEIYVGDRGARRLKVYVERGSNPPSIKTVVWEGA